MSLIKKAKRSESYLKMGMSGVSGSGKTYSALLFAKGFTGDLSTVCVLDTENGSANWYDDLGDYGVLPFSPPFSPERYVGAIKYIIEQGYKFIIIDSASHEWDGEGGCLDIHSKIGGNSFTAWAKVTPLHKSFMDAILQCPAHVIMTMRRKQDYEIVEENGKKVPKKIGLKEVQREGTEYELSVNFDIDINHHATASKDRTGLFSSTIPFKISEQTGRMVKEWNSGQRVKQNFSGDNSSKRSERKGENNTEVKNI